ncbi:YeiH family protein [Paracoccus saliphilus]|uniref:Conserved hypothetical integral membrane protein n=1 Tax=Paracoccus saliphilus TaxID=405559 RepID=A0AA45W5Q3_9RHOB|nr:putative sulfate exporter family transporter [Paracoccus saliphilus]WCR05575.1 putative sulfate exporter family transporter [Paracoccus saliphilus]SIS95782.1 conserved hypothetical integral membrane protein [Paracoccus saliphilus]
MHEKLNGLRNGLRGIAPGLMIAICVALAAQFLSEHYGVPAMLMALLLGMTLAFLSETGRCVEGIGFSARFLLRLGVALLGARISVSALVELGAGLVVLVVLAVVCTILFGILIARIMGRGWRFGVLTGGAVAICGASAAMALAAVLPRNEKSELNLTFTVLGVTLLSTLTMIAYPILAGWLNFDDFTAGFFLGGTIHDVAQVVGAGYSVSETAGDTATLVKLIRVAMLAPVVVTLVALTNRHDGKVGSGASKIALVPPFLIGFIAIAGLNSLGLLPGPVVAVANDLSRWLLLIAIAAVGMKTSLKTVLEIGPQAIMLLVLETAFIACFVVMGLYLL